MIAPTGRQVVLVQGDQTAVVVEVGGGLRTYTVGDQHILDGYAEAEMCPSGRGQALIPWPNRLEDGSYHWDGRELHTPITEASTNTAIHGLTRTANWHAVDGGTSWVVMGHRLHPQSGYPWVLDLTLTYSLGPDGLTVVASARNQSPERAPYGMGFHPYLATFGRAVDDVVLEVAASSVYELDERSLPVGRGAVAGTPYDFRHARPVGSLVLDTGLTDLGRDRDGLATVTVSLPDDIDTDLPVRRVRLWQDEAFPNLQLFTGDHLGDVDRRRRGLAVEPMTGPTNLLRSGEGRRVIDPGQSLTGTWGIRPG